MEEILEDSINSMVASNDFLDKLKYLKINITCNEVPCNKQWGIFIFIFKDNTSLTEYQAFRKS
ncbi:hypothetical protein [Thomasclavelia cocleata]|jgi:hypothetical protein|uniref:hypothetical protein n=1 Tax=Thomasclavelia cocleata TaxID=69824 RepID=UPI00242BF8EA|nr:hypothetical protein [Thomasclavelia cocleata]